MAFPIVNGVEVLIPPPEGYEVDFDNPTLDHSTVRATIWLFALEYALSLVFFGQRVYTNAVLVRQFRLDDCMPVLFQQQTPCANKSRSLCRCLCKYLRSSPAERILANTGRSWEP